MEILASSVSCEKRLRRWRRKTFFLRLLNRKHAWTPELDHLLTRCAGESLALSCAEVFGLWEGKPFHLSLREVQEVSVEQGEGPFPHGILFLRTTRQFYRFTTFDNCRQLQTLLRLLTR